MKRPSSFFIPFLLSVAFVVSTATACKKSESPVPVPEPTVAPAPVTIVPIIPPTQIPATIPPAPTSKAPTVKPKPTVSAKCVNGQTDEIVVLGKKTCTVCSGGKWVQVTCP